MWKKIVFVGSVKYVIKYTAKEVKSVQLLYVVTYKFAPKFVCELVLTAEQKRAMRGRVESLFVAA